MTKKNGIKTPDVSSRRGRFTSGEAENSTTNAVSWASGSSGIGQVGGWGASGSMSSSFRLRSVGGGARTPSSAIRLDQNLALEKGKRDGETSVTVVDQREGGHHRFAILKELPFSLLMEDFCGRQELSTGQSD